MQEVYYILSIAPLRKGGWGDAISLLHYPTLSYFFLLLGIKSYFFLLNQGQGDLKSSYKILFFESPELNLDGKIILFSNFFEKETIVFLNPLGDKIDVCRVRVRYRTVDCLSEI
jgi:hypothetical protein